MTDQGADSRWQHLSREQILTRMQAQEEKLKQLLLIKDRQIAESRYVAACCRALYEVLHTCRIKISCAEEARVTSFLFS